MFHTNVYVLCMVFRSELVIFVTLSLFSCIFIGNVCTNSGVIFHSSQRKFQEDSCNTQKHSDNWTNVCFNIKNALLLNLFIFSDFFIFIYIYVYIILYTNVFIHIFIFIYILYIFIFCLYFCMKRRINETNSTNPLVLVMVAVCFLWRS